MKNTFLLLIILNLIISSITLLYYREVNRNIFENLKQSQELLIEADRIKNEIEDMKEEELNLYNLPIIPVPRAVALKKKRCAKKKK